MEKKEEVVILMHPEDAKGKSFTLKTSEYIERGNSVILNISKLDSAMSSKNESLINIAMDPPGSMKLISHEDFKDETNN